MISYDQSRKILKKAKIKIKDETLLCENSLNRVISDKIYSNILPPLSLLNESDKKDLVNTLKDLNFTNKSSLAA